MLLLPQTTGMFFALLGINVNNTAATITCCFVADWLIIPIVHYVSA